LIDDKINLNFPQTNNYLIIDFSFLSLFWTFFFSLLFFSVIVNCRQNTCCTFHKWRLPAETQADETTSGPSWGYCLLQSNFTIMITATLSFSLLNCLEL
jgi:hypothetical protein